MSEKNIIQLNKELTSEVKTIKTAILESQARAVKAVNQEQLALYYGIGRYISENTRNKNWGSGVLKNISERLRQELPGLRGFGLSSLKNMRAFYESWNIIECKSPITIGEIRNEGKEKSYSSEETGKNDTAIRQLKLANLPNFPLAEFLGISFTHHIRIIENAKDLDERLFYIRYCYDFKPSVDDLVSVIIRQDLYHHQGNMPNNFNFIQRNYNSKCNFNSKRIFNSI